MNRNTILILFVAVIALTGGIFTQRLSSNEPVKTNLPALSFSLPDIKGKQRSISEWQGKIRIINFWATWCPPCLKEIPEFIKLQHEFKNKDLQFIGIAIEDRYAVEEYIFTSGINYPILIGGDGAISLSHRLGNIVNAVPFSLIINRQGQIIHQQAGELSREKILEIISPIL